ncbi:hypothetical protein D3C72_1896540 [compost metagenome]
MLSELRCCVPAAVLLAADADFSLRTVPLMFLNRAVCMAGRAACACSALSSTALPMAKVLPSTSLAVMVRLTFLPSRSISRVNTAGLPGNKAVNWASGLR